MYNPQMLLKRVLAFASLLLLAATVARAQEAGPGYWDPSPLPQQGLATYYARGMMEYVYDYRLDQGDIIDCPECVGTVAMLRAGDIGRKVWLKPPAGDPVGPFLVIDCARRQDVQPLLERSWVIDVSFELGRYWGMNRPLDGVLVFEDPADVGAPPRVSGLPTRFYVDPQVVVISPPTATPLPGLPGQESAVPTSWPTRMPVPLPGVVIVPVESAASQAGAPVNESPTAAPLTLTPGPPPLTPIITTPTAQATVAAAATDSAPSASMTAPPIAPPPAPAPSATVPPEVSLGGAGGGLLARADTASPFTSPFATPTPGRPLRTRPGATTVFAAATPWPTPTPAPEDSFWERVLGSIGDLLN